MCLFKGQTAIQFITRELMSHSKDVPTMGESMSHSIDVTLEWYPHNRELMSHLNDVPTTGSWCHTRIMSQHGEVDVTFEWCPQIGGDNVLLRSIAYIIVIRLVLIILMSTTIRMSQSLSWNKHIAIICRVCLGTLPDDMQRTLTDTIRHVDERSWVVTRSYT